jgi:plastocyanin
MAGEYMKRMAHSRLALRIGLSFVALAVAGCGGGGDDLPKLIGTVGSTDDPDAYEISLRTEDGEEVTTVLAGGEYRLEIEDLSTIHNFHLRPRVTGVDLATEIAGTGEETAVVTFKEPEAYIYFCDAHPDRMEVTFSIHDRIRTQN